MQIKSKDMLFFLAKYGRMLITLSIHTDNPQK